VTEIAALIVDDEPPARRGVRQLLAAHPDVGVAGECRDGREALLALGRLHIDLVFLDVQMPGLDGFGVLRAHGPERMPPVVFVTAYDQFAVRAFEDRALDYLVKPLNRSRFDQALARFRERRELVAARDRVGQLHSLLAATSVGKPEFARIAVPRSGGVLMLPADAIVWIEAVDYLSRLHTGRESYLLHESLASLERRLDPAQFVRVHRSALVRTDRVRQLRAQGRGALTAVLADGTEIPVSRRRRARVRASLTAPGEIRTAR
jgi:two-component system LytT family response regulator